MSNGTSSSARPRARARWVAATTAAALLLGEVPCARVASAQPKKPATAEDETAQKKEEARTRFERGMTFFDKKIWDAALVEFLASRGAYPTRSNTQNAAICLRNLNRFDEALDMFEALVVEFPTLPTPDRAAVEREIGELKNLVGTLEVHVGEAGAQITIDGRDRGVSPTGPLRVSAGTHVVRVYKETFAPFEKRVVVAGAQATAVEVKLETLTQSGRLSISEDGARTAEVLVDNVVVGTTPWQGLVSIGEHVVFLRGEGVLGTQPASATVRINQVTPVVLALEPLEAKLRVEATPSGAEVAIDGVVVGSGVWEGRLRKGSHTVEVGRAGFLPLRRAVSLAAGAEERVSLTLERDPDSPIWQVKRPARVFAELAPTLPIGLVFGGDVSGTGDASIPLGIAGRIHVGYELPSGIGFAFDAGYMHLGRSVDDRATVLRPVGKPDAPGTASDALSLRGLLLGGSAHLHRASPFGEDLPLLFRVGLGVLLGSANDERSGTFSAAGQPPLPVATTRTTDQTAYLYVAPEARLGYRLTERLELSAGVELMLMVGLSRTRWDTRGSAVVLGDQGLAGYDPQTLTGSTMLLASPSLGARWDF